MVSDEHLSPGWVLPPWSHLLVYDSFSVRLEPPNDGSSFTIALIPYDTPHVTTLALGSWPRQRHGKLSCRLGVQPTIHIHIRGSVRKCEGMSPHTPKWTPTLGIGIMMEYWWSPESSRNNLRGQHPMDWKLPYTIINILRWIYLKWVWMIHLNIYNISYGWKKGRESKCQLDSWPLKVENCPELLTYKRHATYHWKDLD
jgi:hypothetical protein